MTKLGPNGPYGPANKYEKNDLSFDTNGGGCRKKIIQKRPPENFKILIGPSPVQPDRPPARTPSEMTPPRPFYFSQKISTASRANPQWL